MEAVAVSQPTGKKYSTCGLPWRGSIEDDHQIGWLNPKDWPKKPMSDHILGIYPLKNRPQKNRPKIDGM